MKKLLKRWLGIEELYGWSMQDAKDILTLSKRIDALSEQINPTCECKDGRCK